MPSRRIIRVTMCLRLTVNVHRDITQIFTLVSQERTHIATIKRANDILLPTRSEINLTSDINSDRSKIIPTEILEIVESRELRRQIISLSLSHLILPLSRYARIPRKIFHITNSLRLSAVEVPRYVGRYIDYSPPPPPVRMATRFPYRLSRSLVAATLTQRRARPPWASQTFNQPPTALRIDHPTGLRRACARSDVDFHRSRDCSQVTLGYDLLFSHAI